MSGPHIDERLCERCQEPIDEDDGHLVECFEVLEEILCSNCWDNHCEDTWVRMEEAKIRK